jgi:hypothetical protein
MGTSPLSIDVYVAPMRPYTCPDQLGEGEVALSGAAIYAVTVLPMMVGQASFGPPFGSWPRLAVALPEALVSFAIMGAVDVLWR